jgi:hypothetical protein
MTVYRKTNGGWAAASNGNIRVKWGGNWNTASYVYRKTNGQWADSGYRGYPLAPQSIWVHAWSFSAVALGFTGPPAGGAPVAYYHLVQTDSNGNWINQVNVGGSPWGNFGVGEDGYYQFYVRSVAASGLASAFTGPVRVRIGHTEQGYWATENRQQGWNSEQVGGYRNMDEPFWVGSPGNVYITGLHWRNLRTGGMSSVVTPGTNRTVNYVFNGGDFGAMNGNLGTIYNGHSYDYGLGNPGGEGPWGLVARGVGWSTTGNGYYMLVCDALWLSGTETYQVSVYYVTRNYQDNGYW